MKIQILGSATQDLIEGHHFYEHQAEGLGEYFLDSLYSDIDSLLISSGVHEVYFGKYHRLLAKRFPFAVYYRLDGSIVNVYAVLDCRRSPAWTRKRLGR
ncbi:MAG: type II toxin-antitoxin system RelE/ParE family toxin [Chromatiales bacterium]|nr:type II toxin-antitoxin system RelE/ParE family toxin [Gammaproteobacteria bacterium]